MNALPRIVFTAYENEPDVWETILTNHPNSKTEVRVEGRSLVGRLTDDTGPSDRILLDWTQFTYDEETRTLSIDFTPIQNQIDVLVQELHLLEDRVSGDEDRIGDIEDDVGTLQTDTSHIQDQINVLDNTVVSLQTQITQLLQIARLYPYGSARFVDLSKLTAAARLLKSSAALLSGQGVLHGSLGFVIPIGSFLNPLSRFKINAALLKNLSNCTAVLTGVGQLLSVVDIKFGPGILPVEFNLRGGLSHAAIIGLLRGTPQTLTLNVGLVSKGVLQETASPEVLVGVSKLTAIAGFNIPTDVGVFNLTGALHALAYVTTVNFTPIYFGDPLYWNGFELVWPIDYALWIAEELLVGESSFASLANLRLIASSALVGESSFASLANLRLIASSALVGESSFASLANLRLIASSTLSGTTTFTSLANLNLVASSTLPGTSTFISLANLRALASSTLVGSSSFASLVNLRALASSALVGDSTLASLANLRLIASSQFDLASTLNLVGFQLPTVPGLFAGASSFASLANLRLIASSALVGDSSVASLANLRALASSALVGESSFASLANLRALASSALPGTSTFTSLANLRLIASSTLSGTTTFTSLANLRLIASSALVGESSFASLANLRLIASSTLVGDSTLASLANLRLIASSTLVGSSSFASLVNLRALASSTLVGSSSFASLVNLRALASSALVGDSTLNLVGFQLPTVPGVLVGSSSILGVVASQRLAGYAALSGTVILTVQATTISGSQLYFGSDNICWSSDELIWS